MSYTSVIDLQKISHKQSLSTQVSLQEYGISPPFSQSMSEIYFLEECPLWIWHSFALQFAYPHPLWLVILETGRVSISGKAIRYTQDC